MDTVMKLGAESPVVIFSKNTCCISYSIETLIRDFGANPTIYKLDELPNGNKIERALLQMGCKQSTPTTFIGKELIGGSNEVISLSIRGKLKELLIKANAIWI
ncbi:monothiol glutaredoxin-S1-like [Lycium barbarum]|uniref:monothiol glutaredoxin-S1-like n=1 Tax=Lycium ferocissimum TaxID=112874 RepID=UPI0028158CAD|nr:monothiol glutaredoxin-S1-like [Lycium ferocissimum]XP_060186285.1 monothiol glutaredoxin-S1-like [Lycium barbarum]